MLEPGKPLYETIKGQWKEVQFQNDNDLVVELACGRGEYTTGLAAIFPEKNFVGVDVKGARIWKGMMCANDQNLTNVAFLRAEIALLDRFFSMHEIDRLWITFPDPRPRQRDEKRRLTSPRYLDMYKTLLKQGGSVHFKTDNTPLFDYTLETLAERQDIDQLAFTHDLYHSEMLAEHYGIRTRYERQFSKLGHDIKYLRFCFTA